jgi:hypothetical protein
MTMTTATTISPNRPRSRRASSLAFGVPVAAAPARTHAAAMAPAMPSMCRFMWASSTLRDYFDGWSRTTIGLFLSTM